MIMIRMQEKLLLFYCRRMYLLFKIIKTFNLKLIRFRFYFKLIKNSFKIYGKHFSMFMIL
jgi:hypothetical protein